MAAKVSMIPAERIEQDIFLIRGHKVMLDADLAALYAVDTGALNRAVRRNAGRFPEDFMFRLTREEFEDLRFHFGTSSGGSQTQGADLRAQSGISSTTPESGMASESHGGRRYPPYAFTEQGVAMLCAA